MSPAPVDRCRVLELGCGDGGNLVPMAYGLPDSEFLGVDLAPTAIEHGRRVAAELGLGNVELVCADLSRLGGDLGAFDFIIAHGVYSWVPAHVRNRLLAVCQETLAPNGVAFVSYNALPGGHVSAMLREMALFDARGVQAPDDLAERAREFLGALRDGCSAEDAYRRIVTEALDQALAKGDAALLHDDLSPDNDPVYFHAFVEHARAHGLQYLAEADFFEMHAGLSSPEARSFLDEHATDILAREQYLDFLKCRRFRQTLLCHDAVGLERSFAPALAAKFRIASRAEPVSAGDDDSRIVAFRGPHGAALRTDEPIIRVALGLLRERWPASVAFGELLGDARRGLSPDEAARRTEAEDARVLGDSLLRAYAVNLVELRVLEPPFALSAGERPRASALARLQVREGDHATTLRHAVVRVEDAEGRRLLGLLDGTRDRAALLEALGEADSPAPDLAARLDGKLGELARLALLEA